MTGSALALGVAYAAATGQIAWNAVTLELAVPAFTMPRFTFGAAVSLALPLFVVTMASQNLPGVAVMRATGYDLPVSGLITMTGPGQELLSDPKVRAAYLGE